MFNHFFTASFLCISLWLHSNEEGKMVILPLTPTRCDYFYLCNFLLSCPLMVVFIQVLANSNQINLQFHFFHAPASNALVAVVIFLRFKKSLLTGWIGSSLKRRLCCFPDSPELPRAQLSVPCLCEPYDCLCLFCISRHRDIPCSLHTGRFLLLFRIYFPVLAFCI